MLAYTLASKKRKKPEHTLRDVKPKAVADTVDDRLAEVKAEKFIETLRDVNNKH